MSYPWNKGKHIDNSHLKPYQFKAGFVPWNKGKKGVMPTCWRKGLTKETSEKIKIAGEKLSKTRKKLFKEGKIISTWKGKQLSDDHKKKQSETKKRLYKEGKLKINPPPPQYGDDNPSKRIEVREKISKALKGRKIPKEWTEKMIKTKLKGRKKPSKEELYDLYIKDGLSTVKIGKMFGFNNSVIRRWLIQEGIKTRNLKNKNHWNWKGGITPLLEKIRYSEEYKKWRKAVFERDNYTCQKCGSKKGGILRAHHLKPFAKYPELRFDVSNGITRCNKCHDKEPAHTEARKFRKYKK